MKKLKKYFVPALAFATVAACAHSARAQYAIPVPNFSFESPAATSSTNPFDTTSGSATDAPLIDDWTAAMSNPDNHNSYGLVNNSTLSSAGTSDGNQSAYVQVYYNYTNSTLTTTDSLGIIAPDTTYTLTVAVGAPTAPSSLDNTNGSAGETAAQADLSLLADGAAASTTTVTNTNVPVGTEADYTTSFTTGASGGFVGENLTIQLEADKAFYPGANYDPGTEAVMFDNVRLSETPEPSTWALLLGAAGVLAFVVRRRSLQA